MRFSMKKNQHKDVFFDYMLVGAAFTIQLTLILQQIKRLNENKFSALIKIRSRKLIKKI
jgi:hypothetical protein